MVDGDERRETLLEDLVDDLVVVRDALVVDRRAATAARYDTRPGDREPVGIGAVSRELDG